jgi:hypothetical protein
MSQKNYNAVMTAIITPMMQLYQPPMHLKNKSADELIDTALTLYGDGLKGFSQEVMRQAWNEAKAAHQSWTWPTVGELSKACKAVVDRTSSSSSIMGKKYPWQIRDERIQQLRGDFMREFAKSELAQQAKQEGWYHQLNGLENYASIHAHLQAQVIAGCSNFGSEGWAWGNGTWHGAGYDFNAALQEEISQTINLQIIRVIVPQITVAWMKNTYRQGK